MIAVTSTSDLGLYESGNGGEISIANNDVVFVEHIFNLVYLSCFGGNTAASTIGNEPVGQPRYDWWANSLIFANNPSKQFNSNTEIALRNNPLNSTGRIVILQAVNDDLAYLNGIADISVNVVILSINTVGIYVTLQQPDSLQNKTLQFIWDNARQQLIQYQVI